MLVSIINPMQCTFFEWSDHEQMVLNELKDNFTIGFDKEFIYYPNTFNVEQAVGSETISIFVDSRITELQIDTLFENGLKRILLRSAGFDMIPCTYAKSLGIEISRVASYSPESVAEHVFALLLPLTKKVLIDRRKHQINQNGRDISQMGMSLKGKTIGFYGMGKTARIAAKIAEHGFNMKVQYFDKKVSEPLYKQVLTLDDLFSTSHVVSINVPLNDETRYSVNEKVLRNAENLILINVSRGGIVITEDVIEALEKNKLQAIGVDVAGDNDLYSNFPFQDNILMTQHNAFFTKEAIVSILMQTMENLNSPNEENLL